MEKQKDILRLFKFVLQPTIYEDQTKIAKTYIIEEHVDAYLDKTTVKEFLTLWKEGFLPKGHCFTVFNKTHLKQAMALFNMFYYAKDWDTFYKTACWAREHINEVMFVYTLQIAVLKRPDTQGMVIPPMYEIFPYYFVNSEVMDKAMEYKMKYCGTQKTTEIKTYTIPAHTTGHLMNTNPEHKSLDYFTEDVALSLYYLHYNADYPFWMGGKQFGLEKVKNTSSTRSYKNSGTPCKNFFIIF